MNPTTAKSAAATNPMASAPMIPSATGSVARSRFRSRWCHAWRSPIGGRRERRDDRVGEAVVDRQPPLDDRLDRVVALESRSDSVARSITTVGSSGIGPGKRPDRAGHANGAADAGDRERHCRSPTRAGRGLEERVRLATIGTVGRPTAPSEPGAKVRTSAAPEAIHAGQERQAGRAGLARSRPSPSEVDATTWCGRPKKAAVVRQPAGEGQRHRRPIAGRTGGRQSVDGQRRVGRLVAAGQADGQLDGEESSGYANGRPAGAPPCRAARRADACRRRRRQASPPKR